MTKRLWLYKCLIVPLLIPFSMVHSQKKYVKVYEHGTFYCEEISQLRYPWQRADFNNDGFLNLQDLNILKEKCLLAYDAKFDLNRDEKVNQMDINTLVPLTSKRQYSQNLVARFKITDSQGIEECFLYRNGEVYRNFLNRNWNFLKYERGYQLLLQTLEQYQLINQTYAQVHANQPIYEIFFRQGSKCIELRFSKSGAPDHLLKCLDALQQHLSLQWHQRTWPFLPVSKNPWMMHLSSSYQNYGSDPYFHHGIDMKVAKNSKIYLPFAGFVSNIRNYIEGNDLYWEVEITELNGLRWQFHHVDKSSIPATIYQAMTKKTLVDRGTYIGFTVTWPQKDMYGYTDHHLHLNCLDSRANYLNPLNFFLPVDDNLAPEIMAVYYTSNEESTALNKTFLAGKVDIIVRIRDFINQCPYELPVYELGVEICREDTGEIVIPYCQLYHFIDLPGGTSTAEGIYTIYKDRINLDHSSLSTCGNYDCRQFYYVVSNNLLASLDGQQNYWDLNQFEDGHYLVTVLAADNRGNTSQTSFKVTVKKKKALIRE